MEWLKQKRLNKRYTQKEVAEKVQIMRASYTQIENGTRRPSVETAKKIARLLDFDWTRFFDGIG